MRAPFVVGRPLVGSLALLLSTACAHSAPAPEAARVAVRELADDALGFAVDLPAEQRFEPGRGQSNVVARSPDGISLRVFPEHFAGPPNEAACWERLLADHLPPELPGRPATASELPALATRGFDIPGARKVFFAARVRDNSCLLLVVDGPAQVAALTASTALPSFRVFAPSEEARRALLLDASMQLLKQGNVAAATARLEELVTLAPNDRRTRLQLARLLMDEGSPPSLEAAAKHLEKVVDTTPDVAFPRMPPETSTYLYAQALMNLGLAHLQLGRHAQAVTALAEAAARVPDDALILYNFACALSLSGEADDALVWLSDALALDPALGEHARTDKDLVSLHARAEWAPLLARAAEAAKAAPERDEGREP